MNLALANQPFRYYHHFRPRMLIQNREELTQLYPSSYSDGLTYSFSIESAQLPCFGSSYGTNYNTTSYFVYIEIF